MRLENFDLSQPFGAINLRGLGHDWDLHNFADFQGITFEPEKNELTMEWRVVDVQKNPWGSQGNVASGCRLRFRGVRSVSLGPRDPAYPSGEALCLAEVSKVIPGERDYPYQQSWEPGEQFHLRLTFQDARQVEIDAESAVLEALESPDG